MERRISPGGLISANFRSLERGFYPVQPLGLLSEHSQAELWLRRTQLILKSAFFPRVIIKKSIKRQLRDLTCGSDRFAPCLDAPACLNLYSGSCSEALTFSDRFLVQFWVEKEIFFPPRILVFSLPPPKIFAGAASPRNAFRG